MDITGKEEDAVSTALFDAAWDENRAIEILLEDGDQLSAWDESGSKKRKNKLKQAADDASKVRSRCNISFDVPLSQLHKHFRPFNR